MLHIHNLILVGSVAFVAYSTPAFAEEYAIGKGETITEATNNALNFAEKAVTKRGEGCLGVGKHGKAQDAVKVTPKDANGIWTVTVVYSLHAGSCGMKSPDRLAVEKAAKKMVGVK